MKNKKKPIPKVYHMILLSIVSILYNYSVICVVATIVILIVFIVRRELDIFENANFINVSTIITGLIIFFPIRKLRRYLLES